METTPQILVVGSDPMLKSEFGAAVSGLRKWAPVVHFEPDIRQGVEAARSRRPDLVCAQIEGGSHLLRSFAEDIKACAPGTAVAALYRGDGMSIQEQDPAMFIEAMRADVQDFLRRPLASGELQQLLDRMFKRPENSKELGRVISIVSNKGGVGKSTLSVNIAAGLARLAPDRVLLVDVSLHLGSCAPMLDLEVPTTLASAAREHSRLDETLVRQLAVRHESGLHVLAAPVDAIEAAEIDDESLARILTLARRTYDYVIVDTFPMLDGLIMSILDLSDRAYVIVQNAVPNVHGAAHFLPVLEHIGFPRERVKVVLNNNFQKCAGTLKTADVAVRLNRDVDHVIPYQKRLITALNRGEPYVLSANRRWGWGKALNNIVTELQELSKAGAVMHSLDSNALSTRKAIVGESATA